MPNLNYPNARNRRGITQEESVELLAQWIVDASKSNKPADLLFLLDTDGCQTYNNETGLPWVSKDTDSRIHPWIARSLIALNQVPGIKLRTSSGGGPERTSIVYEGSHLAGVVDADCGYGADTVTWRPDGTFDLQRHRYAKDLAPLWEFTLSELNKFLQQRHPKLSESDPVATRQLDGNPQRLEQSEGQVAYFQIKSTSIAIHGRGAHVLPSLNEDIQEFLNAFTKSETLRNWLTTKFADNSWGPQDPADRSTLIARLNDATSLHVEPMNNGSELAVDFGFHKDTVLADRVRETNARRVIKINDDAGDRKGMQRFHAMRAAGQIDGLEFASCYPADDTHKTHPDVVEMADVHLWGDQVAGELNVDFKQAMPKQVSAQGRFGILLTQAIERAQQLDATAIPGAALDVINTPSTEISKLSPHPRGIGPVVSASKHTFGLS